MQDYNNVLVTEAVRKGKESLLLPRILLAVGLFFFLFFGWMFFTILGNITPEAASFVYTFGCIWIATFFPFIILPYWFWSKRTTRWKLWAFENVNNVHELTQVARRAALFANYGSFLDRITLQSKKEREQWANLQAKFKRADIFEDDIDVPAETIIYKSATVVLVNSFFYLVIAVTGLFFTFIAFNKNLNKWVALLPLGLAIWMLFSIYIMVKDLITHKPQMIINASGIFTIEYGLQSWEMIFNEALTPGSRRDMGWIFRYNYPNGNARIDIGWYNINHEQLDHLLRTYRGRYNNSKRRNY